MYNMNKQIIHIEQCGFLTTIQDNGRKGCLQYGVGKSGAMDNYAAKLANILAGNDEKAAVLEITQSPHRFLFLKDALIAFAGGGLQPAANNYFIPLCQPVFIREGTIVELKQQMPGYRLYMAVAGGLKADVFLNSVSTDLSVKAGGYHGRPLKKEDILESNTALSHFQKNLMNVLQNGVMLQFNAKTNLFQTGIIRVIHGKEWDNLTGETKDKINTLKFVIAPQSSRMGYRLMGDQLQTTGSCDIVSSPVTQGTVQLISSGELIILMADGQTVGGYARVLQVIAADLHALAQKKPGDPIQFQIVSLQEAEELYLKQAEELNKIKQLIKSIA
jgi:antagonist of KipI